MALHPGRPCVNYVGQDPTEYDSGDSCALDPRMRVVAELLERFAHPRFYAGNYYEDFAERIVRALDTIPNDGD